VQHLGDVQWQQKVKEAVHATVQKQATNKYSNKRNTSNDASSSAMQNEDLTIIDRTRAKTTHRSAAEQIEWKEYYRLLLVQNSRMRLAPPQILWGAVIILPRQQLSLLSRSVVRSASDIGNPNAGRVFELLLRHHVVVEWALCSLVGNNKRYFLNSAEAKGHVMVAEASINAKSPSIRVEGASACVTIA
jgi:hypothetical protein